MRAGGFASRPVVTAPTVTLATGAAPPNEPGAATLALGAESLALGAVAPMFGSAPLALGAARLGAGAAAGTLEGAAPGDVGAAGCPAQAGRSSTQTNPRMGRSLAQNRSGTRGENE